MQQDKTIIKRRRRYPVGDPGDSWTRKQIEAWIHDHVVDGVNCPACGRVNKVYSRPITEDMAINIAELYHVYGRRWGHGPSVYYHHGNRSGDVCKLRFWGLLEESVDRRADGGRVGIWRVTPAGEQFVLGHLAVRAKALIYQNHCFGFEGPWVTIEDCFDEPFDLRRVRAGKTLIKRRLRSVS